MLNLAEYRQRPTLLADWLPWAGLVATGVVLNKDGSFQRTARFRGPDLDSATQGELIATSARLNNALRRLDSVCCACFRAANCAPRIGHHRFRPVQFRAKHADRRAHAGTNQQPNSAASKRSADVDESGAQSGNARFNIVNRLRSTLATSERLIAEAQGLAYDVANMDREFARLYPQEYTATVSGERMAQDARERWQHTLDGLHTAMRMQAQVSNNLAQDESALSDLVNQSQSATGALQAMQATNQLLALQAKQSIQTQQLQITQDRAASLELARQAAATERAREVRRRFLGTGTPYTPQRVDFYSN